VSDTAKQERAVRIMPDLSRQWVPCVLATVLLVSPVSIVSRDAVAETAENPVADVVARVSPAVVRVVTVRPPTPHTSSALAAAADTTDSRGTTALGSGFVIAAQTEIGSQATLRLCRGGELIDETVTIEAWPEAKPIIVNDDGPRTLGLNLVTKYAADGRPIVTVDSVEPNGTAADSGIAKGDIIVEVQQTPVTEVDQALRVFWARSATQHRFAAVLLERGGKPRWIALAIPE
jgi:S1-C subfamily serine protease